MRTRTVVLAVTLGVVLVGHAGPAFAETALTGVSVFWDRGDYNGLSSGWEFRPTQDIVVTKLGMYFPEDKEYLWFDHYVTIYDSSGEPLVSGTIIGWFHTYPGQNPNLVRENGYAYVDVSALNVQLNAGQTYVIASYYTRTYPDWWADDDDIEQVSAYMHSDLITLDRVNLQSSGQGMPIDVGFSGDAFLSANLQFELASTPPMSVQIDIKPGSYPNSINLGSHGVVPVAILSDADFDATTVDPATVSLAGAGVAVRGKGDRLMASSEDVNGDGLLDLMLHVETENLDPLEFQDGYAIIVGTTYDGVPITGLDEITIVPAE